ncbi:MAG: pyruvate kinase [Pseudomonadota bacterium]
MRRTKIVATLGPATDSSRQLEGLIAVGVDVVRLNFSHGTAQDHKKRAQMVRDIAAQQGRCVGILGDLQGPKIRVTKFRDGAVQLRQGADFILDSDLPDNDGDVNSVGLTYKPLPSEVREGNTLVLDDGRIVLDVVKVVGNQIHTRVATGGQLSDNKGINLRGGGLTAPALTDKDRLDVKTAAEIGVDYLAVSFPRDADDIAQARGLLREAGGQGLICAKVERAEALENIDGILEASDAIMVARGDLGVEIGDADLPAVQKRLINQARSANKIVITATQMMESMISNPIPTRAEVFDVANAVIDGTDAVMLSAETAAGAYPVPAVKTMGDICEKAETHTSAMRSRHRIDDTFTRIDESIAMAAMYAANHFKVRAIAAYTESGSTALWMSRISSSIPIYALTRHENTRTKVTLYRGVYPVEMNTSLSTSREANREAVQLMLREGIVEPSDKVIITRGNMTKLDRGTSVMEILEVSDYLSSADDD